MRPQFFPFATRVYRDKTGNKPGRSFVRYNWVTHMNLTIPSRSFSNKRSGAVSTCVLACFGFAAGLAVVGTTVAHAAGNLPDGWSVRADSGTGADNKLTMEGSGFHFVTGGPPSNNGTYFNPAWTATGNHTFSATLTQNVKATHPDAYGLMIGGSDLDGPNQTYTYFEVRQAGEFYIATRKGSMVTPVVPWTKNAAIKAQGADGMQSNNLSIQVNGANVIFSINGTEVSRQPTSAVQVNGMFGFRICHRLDISVTDVKK